jgi:hypothetical protein
MLTVIEDDQRVAATHAAHNHFDQIARQVALTQR